jgi:hypothetical protein
VRRIVVLIAAITGFGLRAIYLLAHPPALLSGTDNMWYTTVAHSIASGHLGRIPAVSGGRVWSFQFPPAYPIALAIGQRLLFWLHPTRADLWTSAALGGATAAAVAALAWRIADRASPRARTVVAAAAGLLVALNPLLAGASVSLMSEALVPLAVTLALLFMDRLLAGPATLRDAVVLGLLVALSGLTRSEALLITAAAVVGAAVVARTRGLTMRPFGIALGVAFAIALAWSTFASIEGSGVIVMSAQSGSLLRGANCRLALHGDRKGSWDIDCLAGADREMSRATRRAFAASAAAALENLVVLAPAAGPRAEAEFNHAQARLALRDIRRQPVAVATSVPYRIGRALGLYWSNVDLAHIPFEGRAASWERVGRWFHLILVMPLALVGVWASCRRRGRAAARLRGVADRGRVVPSLVLLATWLVVIAATYGTARFRASVDPSLVLLAGLGVAVVGGSSLVGSGDTPADVATS